MENENLPAIIEAKEETQLAIMPPNMLISKATEVANVLADVIEKKHLYVNIQGKKFVISEGWLTLGAILGESAQEEEVKELADGSYEAIVGLYKNGVRVGRGSALCGSEEQRWGKAERFARRSMAITRASGKAHRLKNAWIMTLAGYEGTPAEEMENVTPKAAHTVTVELYNKNDKKHQDRLIKQLHSMGHRDLEQAELVGLALDGRPMTMAEITKVVKEVIK